MCFSRPDIALVDLDNVVAMKLTVCFEANSAKLIEYIRRRYRELSYAPQLIPNNLHSNYNIRISCK